MSKRHRPVGIDDMAFYTPGIYLNIQDLAIARQLPYEKLSQGLGLLKMSVPDTHEDAATMAAEAVTELMLRNKLRPEQIGRLYLGTESALDGAKPTATYVTEMVQQRLGGSFRRCDAVDLTFACIAATDALQATLEWAAASPERVGIVVASDVAKYELESSGEYTQGAGAVAMLVRWNPRLLVIPTLFGVSMESVHDFFKPRRERFTETPIFDGPFSNQCYQERMSEALAHFREQAVAQGWFPEGQFLALSERWERMAFHLPYAFHAKRIYVEEFVRELKASCQWSGGFPERNNLSEPLTGTFSETQAFEKARQRFFKTVSETPEYQQFIRKKLEPASWASSETGNLYTASIFLALMAIFEAGLKEGAKLSGKRIGLVAYGSGSKSKVFEGIVQKGWKEVAAGFGLLGRLSKRQKLDYETYERLHKGTQETPIARLAGSFGLSKIGTEGVTMGARYYAITP